MKRLLPVLLGLFFISLTADAQPAKRRVQPKATAAEKAQTNTRRADLQFPTADAMPTDLVWRRDVYRQLDLMLDANAPLYYPIEPQGTQMNLFTYVFRLLLTGRISAYTYQLDGNESFDIKNKVQMKELMDRYYIYYEEEDGKLKVNNTDIPAAEVTRYYIKESSYFDQRTSTYHSKVTAICPVLMRGADEFGGQATPYPLFWLKYDDVAAYLARLPMMASNLNNVTNLTADDYFTLNRYEGKIYKTNNLQGRVLANYCKTDSALAKEQRRIEKQLTDFEKNLWAPTALAVKKDSVAVDSASVAVEKPKRRLLGRSKSTSEGTSRRAEAKKEKRTKVKSGGSGPSAPRVSVRRQRR